MAGGGHISEVTNAELLQAIKGLSNDVRGNSNKINDLETEFKEFKSEIKSDIRKLDQKFTLTLKDLHEARTDIQILQQAKQ